MTRSTAIALIAFLVLTSTVSPAQTPEVQPTTTEVKKPETATIEGRVVRATDGAPIKKATVMAYYLQSGTNRTGVLRRKYAFTDQDGKFLLKDVEPGTYTLNAARTGYALQEFGQRRPMTAGTPITIVAGQAVKDIVFRLVPAGVIAGKVVDEDGSAVYMARVEAQRWRYYAGKRQLMPAGMAMTNDLGEYRISQLAPGRYLVSVSHPNSTMMGSAEGSRELPSYPIMFFPGVYESGQAVPIEVKGGEEVAGISVRIVPVRGVHVRGTVQGGNSSVNVELIPKRSAFSWPDKSTLVDDDGAFDLSGVLPGSYNLKAHAWEGDKQLWARQTIEVEDSDIDDVVLVVKPDMDLAGQVRLEGNIELKDKHVSVYLVPKDATFYSGGMPGEVQQDLTFTLKAYPDDDYRVSVLGAPDDSYLKAASVGGHDVLEDGFRLESPSKPLEIVISANGGRVEGTVTNSQNNPFSGARVVLVPEESRRNRPELFRVLSSDQYGRFSFRGVVPGSYTIYAWESVEEGAYQDPDFLKAYADEGKSIRVGESGRTTAELRVIAEGRDSSLRSE